MRVWIGVENFAKIESAKICVNNYIWINIPIQENHLQNMVQSTAVTSRSEIIIFRHVLTTTFFNYHS